MTKRKLIIICAITIAIAAGATSFIYYNSKHNRQNNLTSSATVTPTTTPTPTATPTPLPTAEIKATPTPVPTKTPTPIPTSTQWPVTYSNTEAASITVVVNKKHKLPSSYAPGLRSEASTAISKLYSDAAALGYNLKTVSGYRSYATQESTYNGYVARDGQELADTYSARPGHSEHQTGLAVDVGLADGSCQLETCFGDTAAGKWLAANAQNYGFIIRYPNGKQAETGYQYEPWHLRFLGIDAAKAVNASGKTLDQYYNVEAGGY